MDKGLYEGVRFSNNKLFLVRPNKKIEDFLDSQYRRVGDLKWLYEREIEDFEFDFDKAYLIFDCNLELKEECFLSDIPIILIGDSYKMIQNLKLTNDIYAFNPENFDYNDMVVITDTNDISKYHFVKDLYYCKDFDSKLNDLKLTIFCDKNFGVLSKRYPDATIIGSIKLE